jgi:uncharacterized protein YndB with AHSA1/START domain
MTSPKKRGIARTIMLVVVALLAGVLIFAATKPDTFRVERTIRIDASADKIFPHLNDFKKWKAWSPWEKMDPQMNRTYSGAPSGKGAVYEWQGNSKVGAGRMEISESIPSSRIVTRLDFLKPMEAHNTAEFTLTPAGAGTQVNWAMYGPAPYLSKVMQVFISMDRMVGKDFEAGLANLKAAAEK